MKRFSMMTTISCCNGHRQSGLLARRPAVRCLRCSSLFIRRSNTWSLTEHIELYTFYAASCWSVKVFTDIRTNRYSDFFSGHLLIPGRLLYRLKVETG